MRYLKGFEFEQARQYMVNAADYAKKHALCLRWKCGSVVVNPQGVIIGQGANMPADKQPFTQCIKDLLPAEFKSDRHCCIHAEQWALLDALEHHPGEVRGSRLYFIRLGRKNLQVYAGKPYCTYCSKLIEGAGLAEVVLWHKQGICVYPANQYNLLSFAYKGDNGETPACGSSTLLNG
jgi:deoxycytidylate deaminase